MERDDLIQVASDTWVPRSELKFSASRSSGPGGQHVNKTSSRITLEFDLNATEALNARQKRRVGSKLATRITQDGRFKLYVQKHRSQSANRELAVERFQELLSEALAPVKKRKATRPGRAAKARRLDAKARRGQIKKLRAGRYDDG